MSNVTFLWIFSRGIELGVIVVCIFLLRVLFRRKVPRLFSYLLWAALPINIVCSFLLKVESNHTYHVVIVHQTPIIFIDEYVVRIMKRCWMCGTVLVVLGLAFSYVRFLRSLVGCIRLQKGVYLADRIHAPFTMGLLCPKIYLPVSLKKQYYEYVILHERVHISRKDVWMKYLAVGFLGLFWFQPLLWFACCLFMNDMEEACDESVIRKESIEFREEYARALVEVSFHAAKVRGAALGYGNGAIKSRIRNIMNYKQIRLRGHLATITICLLFLGASVLISWQVPRMMQRIKNDENKSSIMTFQQQGTGKDVIIEK